MSDESFPYVARSSDVDRLLGHWSKAAAGATQVIRLQAPFGGGRRAVVGETMRRVQLEQADVILWRVGCVDQENGLQWLVRMYGSLVAWLIQDALRRGRAEMVLNAQLPSQPKRVQAWYQQFVATVKEAKVEKESGQVQLRLPQDNPLIGLVEVVAALSRKTPIILELQNPYVVNSLSLAMFVEALAKETSDGRSRLMIVLHDEPEGDVTRSLYPMPLLDYYARNGQTVTTVPVAPWGAEEVEAFLASKQLASRNAARLAEIARGRPGFIAELVDILAARGELDGDLSQTTLASLTPMAVDEDELDIPDAPPEEGKRKHASPDDAPRVAYLAALLGQAFPSGLVADMGGFERESVDDLCDAQEDLYEEMQFSQEIGSWIYRFKHGCWREGILEQHQDEASLEIARRVGLFMERFLVPRGYGFIARCARVYAEAQAPGRAAVLRSIALGQDNPDVWGLCYDLHRYFDEIIWPDNLRKTVWQNLLERLVTSGNVQVAERVHAEATEWATEHEERELIAWLLFTGSRLDARRADLYRARDRANDAIKLYEGLDQKTRAAEVYNHLAMIELQDGKPAKALEQVNLALEAGKVQQDDEKVGYLPGVLATAEHIRGLVARQAGNAQQAAQHFQRANEVAGQVGLAALALDSGLSFGEALLASRQTEQARDVLERVTQIARSMRNLQRERASLELLSQAEGSLRHFDAAIQAATRTLQLTQQLQLEQALPVDLYNLGFFHFAAGRGKEALVFLTQAEQRVGALGQHPLVKELYYFKGMAHLQQGQDGDARTSLEKALPLTEQLKDWGKLTSTLEQLAGLAEKSGDKATARTHLTRAVELAGQHDQLKEARKGLRRKLEALA